jgi:DNA polymerase alpha subunit B
VASGPFTFKNSLSYNGLYDILTIAKKEQPHALILMGPFLDINNQDLCSGELFFEKKTSATTSEKIYITHEELFADLIRTIQTELSGVKTKVIFVPSHKDIHHIEPLP